MIRLLDWIVYPETNTLKNLGTGEEVKLSPRAMDVLGYLIASSGQVITSADLLDRFWGNADRSDHIVHNVIADLRAALGDRASNPRYIKTYTKRGYALIATPIAMQAEDNDTPVPAGPAEPRAVPLGWKLGIAGIAMIALIGIAVVMPVPGNAPVGIDTVLIDRFESINVEPDNGYWADQLPASLVSHLSRIDNLNVVRGLRETAVAAAPQAQQIDTVDYVLRGSVQQEDNRLRLQFELVDADELSIIFSDQIDIVSSSVFDIHDEVGTSIATSLSIYLDKQQRRDMHNWGTASPQAYSLFLKGNFHAAQSNHTDLELALASYADAADEDRDFVNAYIGLARTASMLAIYSHDVRYNQLREIANDALREVERIGPAGDAQQVVRDLALQLETDNRALMEESLKSLIQGGSVPDYAYARYASLLTEARLYYEADRYYALGGEQPPFQLASQSDWVAQTFEESPDRIIQAQKRNLIGRPDHIGILNALIRGLVFAGDRPQAVYYLERLMEIDAEGAFAMLNQVIISGLWGSSFKGGDDFERLNLVNPAYNLSHGVRSFLAGDIRSGISSWRSLSATDRRRLQTLLYKLEVFFPETVLADRRYQALLDELGMGMKWQRHLMESVQDLAVATGVQLHEQSALAYKNQQFLINNNLWNHDKVAYPNRGTGSRVTVSGE